MMNNSDLLNQAIKHHKHQDFSRAEKIYRMILEDDTSHSDANHNLGLICWVTNRRREALALYEGAIKFPPENDQHLKTYIAALCFLGKNKEAIDSLHKAEECGMANNSLAELRAMFVYKKVTQQSGIPMFFDNYILNLITKGDAKTSQDAFNGFISNLSSLEKRFVGFEVRNNEYCRLSGGTRSMPVEALSYSQGSHSVLKWKQYDVFKSSFDLAVYWMLLNELKPEIIVEFGSGNGGSAIWFADISRALGFSTKIYSYDINKPSIEYPSVEFIEFDLNSLSRKNNIPKRDDWNGKVLAIEDAHVNIPKVLEALDDCLGNGDYLVVEDSDSKQTELDNFIRTAKNSFLADQLYLDFFGRNGTSATNSIFRVQNIV